MKKSETKVNINNQVRVKLTPYGVGLLNAYYAKYTPVGQISISPSGFDGENLVTELWHLMAIFGEKLYMGNPNIPFVNNEITFVGRK